MDPVRQGRLDDLDTPPISGERPITLAELGPVRIGHILSGAGVRSERYVQDDDEWFMVLAGAATLDVDGERCNLVVDDWMVIPAGTPHRVLHTEAGTRWLTVHAPPSSS